MSTDAKGRTERKRANELDGKTWIKYSISIWNNIRKTEEELRLNHPAIFPVQLVTRLLECFTTNEEKVVLDPFAGIGSTVVAAERMRKAGIGIEISDEFVTIARNRLAQRSLWGEAEKNSVVHHADANDLLEFVQPETVDIVITSPPYWNILTRKRTADKKEIRDYGNAAKDLGKITEYHDFLKALQRVFELVFKALKKGKYCIVIVMDIRQGPKFYPFHSDIADFMQEIGFIYDDLIIWDRRHEYNNMRPLGYPYVFRINKAHEFILIFQKPKEEGLMNKRLVCLYDSTIQPWHADLQAIQENLSRLAGKGVRCELLDTNDMLEQDLNRWHDEATAAAVWRHQEIRQAFGSRKEGGLPYFGKQVPALLVYEEGEEIPVAVYPHREKRDRTYIDFTIEGFLGEFVNSLNG